MLYFFHNYFSYIIITNITHYFVIPFIVKGYPTVDGEATATNITFAHFTPPVNCTYTSTLISNNPISPDAVHPLELEGVVKLDVPQNNLVYFYDPDPNWIVQEVSDVLDYSFILIAFVCYIGLC